MTTLLSLLTDPVRYTLETSDVALRSYQCEPLPRILDSIRRHLGDTIILVFPRQSGKDEFLVHLKTYALDLYSILPVGIVEVNPTYQPQTLNAIYRFDQVAHKNPLTRGRWRKRGQFTRILDQACLTFLSGDSASNVVGDTASLLLIINEAQDIAPAVYHKKFVPMCASTNATRLLAGTAWNSSCLLSQEIRAARQMQERDGRQRLFMVDADYVRTVDPLYGQHVDAQIASLGRDHPLIKTQYFNEELDAHSGMFNALRLALINSPLQMYSFGEGQGVGPEPGHIYAFLLDVAGQDESLMADPYSTLSNPGRDSATLSIVDIDLSTIQIHRKPAYRVIHRRSWLGENHLTVYGQLKSLAETWNPRYIVMDATGVGEGLWALLDNSFHHRLIPVKYNVAVKSEIGYKFLAIINTGRFRDCAPNPQVEAQYNACQAETLIGPAKTLRWGVPEGRRGPDGQLIHDDYLMADSLVAILDDQDWSIQFDTFIINYPDPLDEMSHIKDIDWNEMRGFYKNG